MKLRPSQWAWWSVFTLAAAGVFAGLEHWAAPYKSTICYGRYLMDWDVSLGEIAHLVIGTGVMLLLAAPIGWLAMYAATGGPAAGRRPPAPEEADYADPPPG